MYDSFDVILYKESVFIKIKKDIYSLNGQHTDLDDTDIQVLFTACFYTFQYLVLSKKGCMLVRNDDMWEDYIVIMSNKNHTGNGIYPLPFVTEDDIIWYELPSNEIETMTKKYIKTK
jgi:hypothetical protein